MTRRHTKELRYRYTNTPSLLQGDMPEDEAICYKCKMEVICEFHHIMNGSAYRGDAEKIGAWVWLCSRCHHWAHTTGEGARYLRKLKAEAQAAYEEDHTRAEWMYLFHKNYRED